MTRKRTTLVSLLLVCVTVYSGCSDRNREIAKDGYALHYVDMSNKAAPGSWLTDNEAEHIMDDAFLVIEKADTLEEKANFLVVYQKASLLKHFMDTLKSDFTVQNMVADAEVDRDTQLQIDSVFVHAHQQIGKRLDEDLLLIDDYIAAAEDEKLRELFRRLKTATIEVRDTIEASLETKTFD